MTENYKTSPCNIEIFQMAMVILLLFLTVLSERVAAENIVSRGKPTSQSSITYNLDSSLAVDGRYENYLSISQTGSTIYRNCFHTLSDAKPFWEVDLQGAFNISHVVLYNRMDCCSERLVGSVVELLNPDGEVSYQCGTINGAISAYHIPCRHNVANKVRVRGVPLTPFHLCEVEVVGESFGQISQVPIIISRGKKTSQSSVYRNLVSSIGVDGRYENYLKLAKTGSTLYPNCFRTHDDEVPFWMVDLQSSFKIDHVLIYNRMDAVPERAIGVVVELLNEYGELIQKCGTITKPKEIYHIPCFNTVASKVRVRAPPRQYLHFCEIEVFTGQETSSSPLLLISRGKPVTVSTMSFDTTGSIAVDGKYENFMKKVETGDTVYKNCYTSNIETNPFWIVDLQGSFKIDHVVVYNRVDCCPERLIGAVVELLSVKGVAIYVCGTITDFQPIYSIPCQNSVANQVRIRLTTSNYLTLCEVDVFGELDLLSNQSVMLSTIQTPISRGKPTIVSSVSFSTDGSIAVDGKYENFMKKVETGDTVYKNCYTSNIETNPFWIVDLQGSFKIDHVVVYNRVDCCPERLIGAVVELLSLNGNVTRECGRINEYKPMYDIQCQRGVANRVRIRLTKTNYLTLCEVDVFGEFDQSANIQIPISRGKPVAVSTMSFDTTGSIAVDGKYENFMKKVETGDTVYKNCYTSNIETNPFWIVDLQGSFKIDHVVVYNRVDCCPERLIGAVVELLSAAGNVARECGKITEYKPIYDIMCQNSVANRVRIRLTTTSYLTLCEVDVFGEAVK